MMTLKQVKAERAEVLKRWEATFGTPAGDACKARIAELLDIETAIADARSPKRPVRMARHCNDHGVS